MDDLCEELWTEIIAHLPTRDLFRCMGVSKSWYYKCFIIFNRGKPSWGSIRAHQSFENSPFELEIVRARARERHFRLDYPGTCLLESCNGLLLLYVQIEPCSNTRVYYVCKPIINQWVALPQPHRHYPSKALFQVDADIGFAFDGIQGHHYKVIRFFWCGTYTGIGIIQCEIFSLENGVWRQHKAKVFNFHRIKNRNNLSLHRRSLYTKGALFWLPEDDYYMLMFDLQKESFEVIQLQGITPNKKDGMCLWVSCRCLHYCSRGSYNDRFIIWGVDHKTRKWVQKATIVYKDLINKIPKTIWSRYRRSYLSSYISSECPIVLCGYNHGLRVMYLQWQGTMFSYNHETENLEVVWSVDKLNGLDKGMGFCGAIFPYLFSSFDDLPKWHGCKVLTPELSANGSTHSVTLA